MRIVHYWDKDNYKIEPFLQGFNVIKDGAVVGEFKMLYEAEHFIACSVGIAKLIALSSS